MLNDFFPKHLADRVAGFAGRQWVLEKVAEWLGDPSAPRVFLITGEPGCGKTALSAWLAAPIGALPVGPLKDARSAWKARHFCMAEEYGGTVQPARFAQLLAQQIGERIPSFGPLVLEFVAPTVKGEARADVNWGEVIGTQIINLIINSPDPKEVYDRSIRQPLERLCERQPDTRIFILVDALDEALTPSATCTIVDLLAGSEDFPPSVRFLLTSRPVPKVLQQFPHARRLNLSDPSFSGAVDDDIRAYINQHGTPGLFAANVEALVTAAEGNFLYVRILLDEVARETRKIDDFATLPIGIHALYYRSLERLTRTAGPDAWSDRFQPLLGRLSVAASEVPAELLGEWTNQQAQIAAHLDRVYQFIEPIGDSPSYRLYHRSMADFLALRTYRTNGSPLPNPYHTPPLLQHKAIADFYLGRFHGKWSDCDAYGLRHLAWHLREAGRSDELHQLLLSFDWLQAKLEATDLAALIADYDYLAGQEELRLIQSAIRLSANVLAQDTRQLAGQLTGRLLGGGQADIEALLKQAAKKKPWPWLRPRSRSLNAPGGPLIRTLPGPTRITRAVVVMSDGRWAVSVCDNCTLLRWDLQSGEVCKLEGENRWVNRLAITADGRRAMSVSGDFTLRLWDLSSGQTIRTLKGHTSSISAVAMTPDGYRAVSVSHDQTLRLWDLESGQTIRILQAQADLIAIAVTPDGWRAVSISNDQLVRLWDLESGKTIREFKGESRLVGPMAITSDGRQAVSASVDKTSGDKTLLLLDLESGQTICTLKGHTRSVDAVAVTPDGRGAVSVSGDNTLRLWDLKSGQTIPSPEAHASCVHAVAAMVDNRRAVSASGDGTLRLWEVDSDQPIDILKGHAGSVNAVAVTPEGRHAVSGSDDNTLRIWDLETGQTIRMLTGHSGSVNAVAVTPEGRHAVSGSNDNTLRVWDLGTGQTIRMLMGHSGSVNAVVVTPDGRHVVSGSDDNTLRVWDLESGQTIRTLKGHSGLVNAVAVTTDGRRTVSGSKDRTLRLWDLESGQTIRILEGHTRSVHSVAVTVDGLRAVSASGDKTLRLWKLEDGKEIATFIGESDMHSCAVARDRCTIIAGELLGRVHFLRLVEADETKPPIGDTKIQLLSH